MAITNEEYDANHAKYSGLSKRKTQSANYDSRNDLTVLSEDISWYFKHGYKKECEKAARYAQCMTRAYVERLHPETGLGGHNLRKAETKTGGTDNLIKKGSFIVTSQVITGNIYSDYFSRWYNTGATHKAKTHKKTGESYGWFGGTYYGNSVYESNGEAIANYFSTQVQEYMVRHVHIKRR